MTHKKTARILTVLLIVFFSISFGQVDTDEIMCFDCHSDDTLTKVDSLTKRTVNLFVSPEKYKQSIHKNLTCTDCHSEEFEEAPHPEDLAKEEISCLDCHEDGEVFKFETIQAQVEKGIHFQKLGDDFTCFVCHDPHNFHISARFSDDIKSTVQYDNSFCMNCHKDEEKTGKHLNLIHEFLPHKERHWNAVRCIDCHAQIEGEIVSHMIGAKETAVRTCVECHSQDSRLLQTLYAFKSKEERKEKGFINGVILNDSYVIGATRNYFFNVFSIILLFLTIAGISIHLFFRIKSKKER